MSAQTVSTCVVCGSETDAFLCGNSRTGAGCLGKLMRSLGDVAALRGELDTVLARQNKTGAQSVGYVTSGGEAEPLPLNLKSTEVDTHLRDIMCLWVRDLHETHSPRDADGSIPPVDVEPSIVPLSRWLMRHPTWIAIHPAADDLYEELMGAMGSAWHAANFSAPGTAFYGVCFSVLEYEDGEAVECHEHLYGRPDAWSVTCKTCGTEHEDLGDRQNELDWALEEQFVPMGDLVGIITGRGTRVTSSMIRGLVHRKRIASWSSIPDGGEGYGVTDRYGARVRVRTPEDEDLQALYLVREVLDAVIAPKSAVAA